MKDLKERAIKATKLFLERRGYGVVETGWECPAGAIDVVAMEDDILVLVEVSARTADEGGFPEGSRHLRYQPRYAASGARGRIPEDEAARE